MRLRIYKKLGTANHNSKFTGSYKKRVYPTLKRTFVNRDVEAVRFLMLSLPAPLEVLCFRLRIELVASASSLFHQNTSASTKI